MPIDDTAAFSEAMFLLLGEIGVGYQYISIKSQSLSQEAFRHRHIAR